MDYRKSAIFDRIAETRAARPCSKGIVRPLPDDGRTTGIDDMSKVIRGFVVSRNPISGMWRGWDARGECNAVCADTYRGLLAMIRECRA